MRIVPLAAALALLLAPVAARAGGRSHGGPRCYACEHRSSAAKSEFKREHPCPATRHAGGPCAGYVIDHIKPLKRGGSDVPSNMQWQTKEAAKAKAKDKWE